MSEKKYFKKSSKFLEREGFYIVLFICLCIVAVAAVYISRSNIKKASLAGVNTKKEILDKSERSTDPLLTNGMDKTAPTSKQPVKSTGDIAREMLKKSTSGKASISKTSSTKVVHNSNVYKKLIEMAMPVEGQITKKFDNTKLQESKTLGQWETHEGIDIAADIGTEVKSAEAGKVIDVIDDENMSESQKTGYGMKVVIEHSNGIRTVYCNLAPEVKVKKGDSVKKGAVLGTVGDTSVRESVSIEGSHIHFEVLKKEGKEYVCVNPADYLKK